MKRSLGLSVAILALVIVGLVGCPLLGKPPAAPTGVSATAGNGQVAVIWSAVSGASSYCVYYKAGSSVTKSSGTEVANATSPKVVANLTNGTQYAFVVTAINASGEIVQTPSQPLRRPAGVGEAGAACPRRRQESQRRLATPRSP